MKRRTQIFTSVTQPGVVGTVHSQASLAAARRVTAKDCDWLEVRVDGFYPETAGLPREAGRLPRPRIVTVRHGSEGGAAEGMTAARRRRLYLEFLPVAGLIDIELRQAGKMGGVIEAAREAKVGVILSHHDFQRTPPLKKLRALAREAREEGADVFKVAAMTFNPRDLAVLLEFIGMEEGPLAVMGMGGFGKISRLALARAGSLLNYGYLGAPNASGQWPVAMLKARIAELRDATG